MKCPNCSKEFADGLQNCPYCGYSLLQDDSKGKFNVPKFTGAYKMTSPRVKNQKEALKKINASNNIAPNPYTPPLEHSSNAPVKTFKMPTQNKSEEVVPLKSEIPQSEDGVKKKPLTREELELMEKKASSRHSENDANTTTASTSRFDGASEDRDDGTEKEKMAADRTEDSLAADTEETEPEKKKKKLFSFGRKKKEKKKKEATAEPIEERYEENPDEERYDVNYDGYYDDLIPELAHQINKIPQENIIKSIFVAVFVVIMIGVVSYMS